MFVRERLIDRSEPLDDNIQRNNLRLWTSSAKAKIDRDKLKLKSSRTDCQLFSRLYIGCQNREGNLDEFFTHENQASPPSLSDGEIIRQGSKSDLIPCIEKTIETSDDKPAPYVLILDGAATVQMLTPRLCKTFLEYSDKIFLPYLSNSVENVQRLDVTRAQRGKETRKRVLPSATMPQNWQTFLRSEENKKELCAFLSQQAAKIETNGKQVIVTHGKDVLCYPSTYSSKKLSPCSHEEADTRMMVHVADAVDKAMILS